MVGGSTSRVMFLSAYMPVHCDCLSVCLSGRIVVCSVVCVCCCRCLLGLDNKNVYTLLLLVFLLPALTAGMMVTFRWPVCVPGTVVIE